MERALPSPQTNRSVANLASRGAKSAIKGTLNLGSAAFNKMFPTLGKFMGGGDSKQNKLETESKIASSRLDNELQLGNEKLSAVFDNQEELNRLLERLLIVYKTTPTQGVTGSDEFPDLGGPDLDRRRRDARRAPRSSKWDRFRRFISRRSTALYARVATKLVAGAFLAAVPLAGWLGAAIMFGADAQLLYQLWQEFTSLPEEQEDENEDQIATRERQQEAARETLGDVSQMGETQNLTREEQPVQAAQEQHSERRREQAGLSGNLEDPVRQEIMQRLAAQRQLAARPGMAGRAATRAVAGIETELAAYNIRNPISETDASRIRTSPATPVAPVAEAPATPVAEAPTTPVAPVAEVSVAPTTPAAPVAEVSVAPTTPAAPVAATRVIAPVAATPTQPAAAPRLISSDAEISPIRIEGASILYNFDKIIYEAEVIKFDGPFETTATPVTQPSVSSISNIGGEGPISAGPAGSGAGTMPAAAGTTAMRVGAEAPISAGAAGSGAGVMAAAAGTTAMRVGGEAPISAGAAGSGAGTMSTGSGSAAPAATQVGGTPPTSGGGTGGGASGQGAAPGSITRVAEVGPGFNAVQLADGTVERRTGARNWRNNNPGNIEFGGFARRFGAIAGDPRFAIFPTYEDGRRAKEALLFEGGGYAGLTIAQAITRYAPPSENPTARYIQTVASAIGVDQNTPLASLNAQQRTTMLASMERVEGFRAGQIVKISGPTGTATAAAPAPASPAGGTTLAQASTARVATDREQTANTQRMAAGFNQQQTAQGQQPGPQAAAAAAPTAGADVALRTRILSSFDQLARAS